jgi:hypothetical protein
MIKNQVLDSAPVTTRYSTFTGGFGMIVCFVGALGLFLSFIPPLVPVVLDGLAGLLFLAGGIVRCLLSYPRPPLLQMNPVPILGKIKLGVLMLVSSSRFTLAPFPSPFPF